jgi:hypothetical protein
MLFTSLFFFVSVSYTFSEISTKFDAVPLLDPSLNQIRPDKLLHIKIHKNQHDHPAA